MTKTIRLVVLLVLPLVANACSETRSSVLLEPTPSFVEESEPAATPTTVSRLQPPTLSPPTATATPTPISPHTPTRMAVPTHTPSRTPTPSSTPTPVSFESVLDTYPLYLANRWIWYVEFDEQAGWDETQITVSRTLAIITDTVVSFEIDGPVAVAEIERQGDPRPSGSSQFRYLLTSTQVFQVRWDDSKDVSHYRSLFDLGLITETWDVHYQVPLVDGDIWPQHDLWDPEFPYMYAWHIGPQADIDVPVGSFEDCFQMTMMTASDGTFKTFCPGIGPVRIFYNHHGEVIDRNWWLIGYRLAPKISAGPIPTPRPTYTPWILATATPQPTQ